jgi:integrase
MVAHMKRLLVTQGYSPQTRDTYIRWTQRFTKFLGHPHPRQIGTKEIASFLDHLANDRGLSAATRNQATAAIKYLMREVLASDAADSIKNSKGPKYVPTVLSHAEASMILREMSGRKRLACRLQYGTGMRIGESLSLRIKDIDFELAESTSKTAKEARDESSCFRMRSDLTFVTSSTSWPANTSPTWKGGPAGFLYRTRFTSRSPKPVTNSAGSFSSTPELLPETLQPSGVAASI